MYQRILVPFDGSATSTCGLDEAIKLAALTGASLRILHLVDDLLYATGFETYAAYVNDVIPLMREAGERILQEGKARAEKAGVPVETQLVEGFATRLADVVADQADAWHADLIVIGTHGRRGVSRLVLGSDAEHIMRTARVPVLQVGSPRIASGVSARDATSAASFAKGTVAS